MREEGREGGRKGGMKEGRVMYFALHCIANLVNAMCACLLEQIVVLLFVVILLEDMYKHCCCSTILVAMTLHWQKCGNLK